jgi:hypothetical protein
MSVFDSHALSPVKGRSVLATEIFSKLSLPAYEQHFIDSGVDHHWAVIPNALPLTGEDSNPLLSIHIKGLCLFFTHNLSASPHWHRFQLTQVSDTVALEESKIEFTPSVLHEPLCGPSGRLRKPYAIRPIGNAANKGGTGE